MIEKPRVGLGPEAVFIILAGCLLSYVLLERRGDSDAARRAEIESIIGQLVKVGDAVHQDAARSLLELFSRSLQTESAGR